jgi:hypothetical protein
MKARFAWIAITFTALTFGAMGIGRADVFETETFSGTLEVRSFSDWLVSIVDKPPEPAPGPTPFSDRLKK